MAKNQAGSRENQLKAIQAAKVELNKTLSILSSTIRSQLSLLDSVSLGLYEEIDKLTKKAPAEQITDLALSQINQVIRETKDLASDDPYIQRLVEFVAAGDNPQHRDAVVVLRQVRQGLERFSVSVDEKINRARTLIREASVVEFAIEFLQETGEFPACKRSRGNNLRIDKIQAI